MGYYITNTNFTSTKSHNDLAPGPRIIFTKNLSRYLSLKAFEGPFTTIKDLKKRSIIYKHICKFDPKRAEKICLEKNIVSIPDRPLTNMIFTSNDSSYSKEFMSLIHHTIKGKILTEEISGIHFFNNEDLGIINIVKEKDINGVWGCTFKFKNNSGNKISKVSTFFPIEWNITQLFHECDYAFKNKQSSKIGVNRYISHTKSRVPVIIICVNEDPKTIYPVHMNDILTFI